MSAQQAKSATPEIAKKQNFQFAKKTTLRSSAAPHRRAGKAARRDGGDDDAPSGVRFISKPEVLDKVGVSYVTLWEWQRKGQFPRGRIVGGQTRWIEAEVDEWIKSRPVRPYKGDVGYEAAE